MFGNPEGDDHLDMDKVHRSAAFGFSISDRGSEVKKKETESTVQVAEEGYTPATEEDLQFIDEMIQQTSA